MEDEEPSQPSVNDSNFYFGDIVYFKEENCVISDCSNHSPEKCRQSKFLLFPIKPEWKEIIAGQVEEEVNLDHEDVRICGKHFAEPAAEDLAPSLFGFETLKEHAGIPYKAQKWCCVKNCSNGYQKYSGTTTSTRKPAIYYPLTKLADDDVGRSLMKELMAKVNGVEDHSAFICHLHLKVLHIDDEVTDAENFKYSRGKNVRYTSTGNKYNIKLDCNLDTTDKSCCVIPSCVFADKTTVYSMGDKQWRPSMFPFPSLHRQPVPRMIWLRLVREAMPEDQKHFCPSVTSMICGLHFPDGKPTLANPDPTHLEKKIIFPPELDGSLLKSRQKEHSFDLSTSTASDALKKAVELRGLVESKRSNTIHSKAVKQPSVAHDESEIESDEDLDNRLQECQQLMEEDSEDDSEEETDDASENDSDDEMQEGSDESKCSASQDSFETMGKKLKRFFRYKDWINAMRVLEKITESFNETFVGTADEHRVFVSVDREGTEQNCTKETKTEALQYVKEHFLQEQDWSQLDLMLKHFDIIEDMPPLETSDESDASSEEEDEGSDAAERSLLLSLSKKFKYHLKSLEWTKADKTLNRVTLVFFEAVIMDSCSSKPGKKLKEEVSRRQSFKTAELKAVEHLRKQMDSINERKLMNEMLKLFGRHSAVPKSYISSADVIHPPVQSKVQQQPALKPKTQTSTIPIKPSVAKATSPAVQSSQLMKEIKAMESELMVAASKVEAKKVSDILKQIGIRLIAVDKKVSIQQVEKDYEEISSPMELKQKALQYLKQHGILCQVRNERNQSSLPSTPTKHHTRQTTILHDTIKAIETPKENTNAVIYQEVTSSADHVATSKEPGVKRKYANKLQVDKNGLQTIYVHFNIEPPKKRRRKIKTSINGSKTLTTESSSIHDNTTAQQCNQPIPMERDVPHDEETVACFESESQDTHIEELQDNKEKGKLLNEGGIENKSQEELCMVIHGNMKHLQNDKEKLKDQNEGEVENNSQKEFCMDTDETDMKHLHDENEKETLKPQNEGCFENKAHKELCMNADEKDLKQEQSLENKSIENHLENNLKEDEHCQARKVSPKNCIPEECTEKKTTLPDNFKEVCNRTDLEKVEDHQLSKIEPQTSDSNFETTANNKDICCRSENNKTILDSKTGVFTKKDDINKDVITTVPDNDDKKHETILDAKTGAWIKQLKDSSELPVDNSKEGSNEEIDNVSGNISEDIQYIVTFDATNFKQWKLLTEGEIGNKGENIIETNSSSPILSTIIKGAIDSDLPSLVYQAKSSEKQLTSVDQKVSKSEIKADVNVDQTQPIDNVASDVFEGIASGYPGYTASTTPQVKRIPVFAFYNEFRPWLLFPFGRALRKLLLCTPIRMSNQKDKPTNNDDNQFVIDMTDAEMKKAVQDLAKVLGKWEKVKDANTYFNGIKVVVNDLLKTSESGIFWNMFVKSFIEAVDKELPNIVAQCEEEIKNAKDTKETQVVAKETGTNPPPPPPLKHGPSMQPKGKVSTITSMPELSHCSTKQPSIVMPALKPSISNQIQQGQGLTISMPPRLVGPFTSNRKILSKGSTGQQVQTQPPSKMVSVKLGKSNIILLPTSQGKTQFVVGNSPVTTVNAQPVSQSQVFQINCASNQTSSTSGGTSIILNQPQLTNAKVTQNQVKSVSAGQSVGHLMVPVTVPGLQKGYVMFVPHTVNLSTTSQAPVSTVSSLTPSPAVKSNTSQAISSTIPLAHKPDAEDKQGNVKMKELVTDNNVIRSKKNPECSTSSNLSESILLQKSPNAAITKFSENHDKDVQLDNNGTQINKENVNDHGDGEMEVVYQPEKLSSICKQVLKKMNNEEDLSEASFHDEEPDEGSGSSSDSNSPPDKPSNNDGTPEHEDSSEKKPKTKPFQQDEQCNEGKTNLSVTNMKSDAAPSCISKSTSSIQKLLATPSLISNTAPSTASYIPVQQFKDPMIFINRTVPGQAAPLPFLVMQTHTIPRPLLMKTSENGQRDISAISPIASSQLFKETKKLNVPYLTINNKQETSSTISSSSNNSNIMDDIKSSDFKQNTTIPRNGSLHLKYLKVWNSQFHRFEDLAVQKYEEECKLHTKLHQLSSITKQIYKHVSAKFNRKNSGVHEDDQTKSETMAVKGTKSPVCSDKAQSSKELSGDEIKCESALESQNDDDKGLVEEKHIANKCNAGSCVESKELAKNDKTPDDMQIETAPTIIKSEANIHSIPTDSTLESNQGKDCDKKINNDEKCIPDMVCTSGSSVPSAPVADGSNERTRLTGEHRQIDKVDNNLHHRNSINSINPNISVSDSLCNTKKDPKEICDSGCTCNTLQMYVCDNCLEVFLSMEDLNKHVIIHLSTEKVLPTFSCENCQLNFTSKSACDCHRESHKDLKWNRCAWCGMMFNQVENLENHLLVHYDVNSERIYECKCSRLFIGLKAIRMHMEDHFPEKTDKRHQCNQCTASFHFVKNMKKHKEDIHNKPSDRWLNVHWRCQKCLSNSTSIHRLNAHMEDHNDKTEFTCGNCPKSFQHFLNYIMHCMNHCEDRVSSIFNCPICDGLFGIDIKTHLKQHLSGMKRCQFCFRFFATYHGLNKHLTEKHKAKIAEKQRKIAEKHKFKINVEHTQTSNNRDSGAADAINKSLSNQNETKIAGRKEGHFCFMCGIKLGTGNFDHPICSTCAKDCFDCPFTCGAKFSNQRHLASHLVALHMERKKHDSLLLVCPHCQTSCRNAGTMALHWIKHCPKNKKRLEMNNNTDKWLEKMEVLETLPALQIIRKHKKKKRKHVDRDDETYTKFKKKKKHKKSKKRVGHKLPQRPYVKLDSHRKHRYKYSGLESHKEHKSMYSDLVPKLSTRHDEHEIKCVSEVKDPVNTAEPTKRNRKKRVYEDMIEIPRSVLLPKLPLNKVGTKQHIIKDIAIDTIKKPRRTSRISKPKEFPDYEEDIDKALRNNQAIKKQKLETSKSQKKINAAPKPEKETVNLTKQSRTSCPVTNEESDSDMEVYETYQASIPVKDRVRPSNLRPRINSGHKWDLFHVDTILSTIDKLKSRLGRKNRPKDSDVNKKLLKKGKLLQKKILQMKEGKCSRKRNVKILTTQQIVALDHCYLGLPKFMSKKKKGPVYAAPVDHDYVIGPRMDPSLEAEKDLAKKRNETMEEKKELTKERLASKLKSKKSPKKEDQLSASAQISQIAASLKKDSAFHPEERIADETDFDDIVKALLDIGCSTSGIELDTDDKDFQSVTSENNLDNDLVDFLADMVSIEENENNEEEGDDNLMNVDLSINDSAILDGLSDLDGNTSGSQEQIDWIPIGNTQQDQKVNMSNENEAFFQISNTIDILSQESCCEDNKNQLNLKNIPDTQEEAFVSNLRPQDVEQVLDIIADKMVQNNCNVEGKEQQMHLDLNITNYADAANSGLHFPDSSPEEQKEVSNSESNNVNIDNEQNCYINNEHESGNIDAEKTLGICSEVSLSISTDEASESNTEECSLHADGKVLSVTTNDEASETSLEECSLPVDEKMNKIKEIFGSFPTQMNVESSHMLVDMRPVGAANSKLSFQGNFSEDQSKVSDSVSNDVDQIHHEQNCDIINKHESGVFDVGKEKEICAEVSLSVSANDEASETSISISEDEKSHSFSDDASETNNEECLLQEVRKSQEVSANDEASEISNEKYSIPENVKSHSVSANDEASETINEDCSLQADVKSDSVSTKDEASETTTERCSLIADEKMNKIKEIFGSLPTQINIERSCIAIGVQRKDDVDKIQSELLSESTEKLQDSGVFVLSDNDVDVLQV